LREANGIGGCSGSEGFPICPVWPVKPASLETVLWKSQALYSYHM